jgi:hypothetical protein
MHAIARTGKADAAGDSALLGSKRAACMTIR